MEVLIEVSNLSAFIVVKGCEFKIENEIGNIKSIFTIVLEQGLTIINAVLLIKGKLDIYRWF